MDTTLHSTDILPLSPNVAELEDVDASLQSTSTPRTSAPPVYSTQLERTEPLFAPSSSDDEEDDDDLPELGDDLDVTGNGGNLMGEMLQEKRQRTGISSEATVDPAEVNNPGITDEGDVNFSVDRNSVWLVWHWELALKHYHQFVNTRRWRQLEILFDIEAEKKRTPEDTKTAHAIQLRLSGLSFLQVKRQAELAPESVQQSGWLTKDEKFYLALIKGDDIMVAARHEALLELCPKLAMGMVTWGLKSGKRVEKRSAAKLYNILSRNLNRSSGVKDWFYKERNKKSQKAKRDRAAAAMQLLEISERERPATAELY